MKIFDTQYLDDLICQAKARPRPRQHRNIHKSYQDSCQRLFNAIKPASYIRPHRHAAEPRQELLVEIRGSMVLVTFDNQGSVMGVLGFGSEKYGKYLAMRAEVESDT